MTAAKGASGSSRAARHRRPPHRPAPDGGARSAPRMSAMRARAAIRSGTDLDRDRAFAGASEHRGARAGQRRLSGSYSRSGGGEGGGAGSVSRQAEQTNGGVSWSACSSTSGGSATGRPHIVALASGFAGTCHRPPERTHLRTEATASRRSPCAESGSAVRADRDARDAGHAVATRSIRRSAAHTAAPIVGRIPSVAGGPFVPTDQPCRDRAHPRRSP